MSINKKYILPILLLGFIILAVIFREKASTFKKNEQINLNTNKQNINHIDITYSGNTISLFAKEDKWFDSNNSTINKQMVLQLLEVLEGLQINSSIPNTLKPDLIKITEEKTYDLRIYSNNKSVYQLSFAIFKGKDFIKSKQNDFYYISIPGYGFTSLNVFVPTNIEEWYDKLIINLKPKEITAIKIEYPLKPESSFRIEKKEENIKLWNILDVEEKDINSESLNDYLSFFSGIRYSYIDTTFQEPNTNNHLFRLLLNTNTSKLINIDGFELMDKDTKELSRTDFVGIINNSIMMKLSYSDFDPILVERDFFLKK